MTKNGCLSTAGTTACTVTLRKHHFYVTNVGDSRAILAVKGREHPIKALLLTKDHKPRDPSEKKMIEDLGETCLRSYVCRSHTCVPGGAVTKLSPHRHTRATTKVTAPGEENRNMGVSRSLGDFWSFNPTTEKYIIRCQPDVFKYDVDLKQHKFIVIASDGLWDVMKPNDVVRFIYDMEDTCFDTTSVAKALVTRALENWKKGAADNISVIIIFFDLETSTLSSPKRRRLNSP